MTDPAKITAEDVVVELKKLEEACYFDENIKLSRDTTRRIIALLSDPRQSADTFSCCVCGRKYPLNLLETTSSHPEADVICGECLCEKELEKVKSDPRLGLRWGVRDKRDGELILICGNQTTACRNAKESFFFTVIDLDAEREGGSDGR